MAMALRSWLFVPGDSQTKLDKAPGIGADVVIVDGYDADAHAEELASTGFYAACRSRLRDRGMLVVNLWGGDRLFETLVQRIESAFPGGTLCLPAERPGNVIVFGFRGNPGALEWKALHGRAQLLEKAFGGLEFSRFVEGLRQMNRCDERFLYAARVRRTQARTGFS